VSPTGRRKFLGSFFGTPTIPLLALACLAAASRPLHAADPTALEKQVKSAFVVNFLQFIDWPATAFGKPDDPIIIGVADPNSLGDSLASAIEGKTIRGRKLVIHALDPKAPGACHVLIAGNLEGADLQALLKAAPASGCLTIGDSEHFAEANGVIRFFVEDRKERFEINLAAAQRAGLQISSKLLKLAKVVN
jgi:hypothetical protein